MGETTSISWTDKTFNPWEGCTKVSPGCSACYAETRNARFGGGTAPNWGKGRPRRRTSAANWKLPLKWNREAAAKLLSWETFRDSLGVTDAKLLEGGHVKPERPRVFCASLADWLDDEAPIAWLADLLKVIRETPNLDWQLLTKRIGNFELLIRDVLDLSTGPKPDAFYLWLRGWLKGEAPANVWLGTSVEDQTRAEERIHKLLAIPAKVRFLSMEPLLGEVDLTRVNFPTGCLENVLKTDVNEIAKRAGIDKINGIDWVIAGGESGKGARPCNVEWIRSLVAQCKAASAACFVKQLGADPRHNTSGTCAITGEWVGITNSPMTISDKKGGDMAEWPEDLRIRQFPV